MGEAGLVVEFAQRLLCRICIAGQNEAVAKWLRVAFLGGDGHLEGCAAAEKRPGATVPATKRWFSEAQKMPLTMEDLRLVLTSCQEALG